MIEHLGRHCLLKLSGYVILCLCRSPMKAAKPGTSTSGAKRKAAAGGNTGSAKKAKPAENGAKKKQPRKRKAQTGRRPVALVAVVLANDLTCWVVAIGVHSRSKRRSIPCSVW